VPPARTLVFAICDDRWPRASREIRLCTFAVARRRSSGAAQIKLIGSRLGVNKPPHIHPGQCRAERMT
jgi:hypothetical protein